MPTILSPADPTRDDSRICRVEGCRRSKFGVTGNYVKRYTTCKRHLHLGTGEAQAIIKPLPTRTRTVETVGLELKVAWSAGDYTAVTALQAEYRTLTDRPMTANEQRIARAL